MSPETAARLDLGFSVLVPGFVPAPFSGEPSVYASGGYYSLYWVIYGGPPTFLEVTGESGGDIPDGSAYDLNVPLVVNASVQGYPAYHDLTPIYDTVWWQVGDVVYKVSSQNLAGTDSVSLANALMTLVSPGVGGGDPDEERGGDDGGGDPGDPAPTPAPILSVPEVVVSGEVATLVVEGVAGATLQADAGIFVDTGSATYAGVGGFSFSWRAPEVGSDQTLGFVLIDPASGEWLATASTEVLATGGEGIEPDAPEDDDSTSPVRDPDAESDDVGRTSPASVSATITSDLTGALAMICPTVGYSGRLIPISLAGESPAVIDATLGGWPDEPGNRGYDATVDGGPTLDGGVDVDEQVFLHWRAPTVTDATTARFFATHPDGTALAECQLAVQPGQPPARVLAAIDGPTLAHDGTGGPRPFRSGPSVTGVGGGDPDATEGPDGDGSGGPVLPDGDGSGGPEVPSAV